MIRDDYSRPPALNWAETALFVDLDGTIAEFAPHPDDVTPSARRTRTLLRAQAALGGRLAILTGRSLGDADRILQNAVTAVAAVHGLVRRMPGGETVRTAAAPRLAEVKAALREMAEGRAGIVIEDKEMSVAVHYRQAPSAEPIVRDLTTRLAQLGGLALQEGAMVSEVRTLGPDKGDSLRAFLQHPIFAGVVPIVVGDDLTDEGAFAAAASLGGYGVLVGERRPTQARFRLPSVEDVLTWLTPEGPP